VITSFQATNTPCALHPPQVGAPPHVLQLSVLIWLAPTATALYMYRCIYSGYALPVLSTNYFNADDSVSAVSF